MIFSGLTHNRILMKIIFFFLKTETEKGKHVYYQVSKADLKFFFLLRPKRIDKR